MSTAHITSVRTYVFVFAALIVFTLSTVLVAKYDFGWLNTPVALTIAVTKATLVVVYFMTSGLFRPQDERFRADVRRFVDDSLRPQAAALEKAQVFPRRAIALCARHGCLSTDPRKNAVLAEEMPRCESSGLARGDIARVIPHNVSLRSWEILMGLLELPRERLFADNIASNGHVIAADNFINLKDATDRGLVTPGDRLLLFNFGFGANWACMVVEH